MCVLVLTLEACLSLPFLSDFSLPRSQSRDLDFSSSSPPLVDSFSTGATALDLLLQQKPKVGNAELNYLIQRKHKGKKMSIALNQSCLLPVRKSWWHLSLASMGFCWWQFPAPFSRRGWGYFPSLLRWWVGDKSLAFFIDGVGDKSLAFFVEGVGDMSLTLFVEGVGDRSASLLGAGDTDRSLSSCPRFL